jgi:hypothetical protein
MRYFTMKNMTRLTSATAMLGLLSLAACDPMDPLKRDYYWRPANVNQSNMRAMAANPSDLSRGRTSATGPAITQTDAVARVWTGNPTPLPQMTAGSGASTNSTGASGTTNGRGGS